MKRGASEEEKEVVAEADGLRSKRVERMRSRRMESSEDWRVRRMAEREGGREGGREGEERGREGGRAQTWV